MNHIAFHIDHITNKAVFVVKPSRNLAPQVFTSSTNWDESLQFLKEFDFKYSDLKESQYIHFSKSLIDKEKLMLHVVILSAKLSTPFRIRLKPDVKLQRQRTTQVPFENGEKLNALFGDVQKTWKIKPSIRTPHEKPNPWVTFLNPWSSYKNDSVEVVLNARHLNSNIDQPSESWPLVQIQHCLLGQIKNTKVQLILCLQMHVLH